MDPPWLESYRALLLIAGLLGAFLLYQSLRQRDKRGSQPLCVLCLGGLIYVGVKLVVSIVRDTPDVLTVSRFTVLGATLATTGFLLLTVEYTGLENPVSRRTATVLAVEPIVANCLIWYDLELFWVPLDEATATLSGYEWELTSVAIANQLYMGLLMVTGLCLLFQFGRRSPQQFDGQILSLCLAGLAPLFGNLVYYAGYSPVNLTPVAFVFSSFVIAWAILWKGFLDLAPVGRNTVVEELDTGVLTVDRKHRVIDTNPCFRELLGLDKDQAEVGTHVDDLFADRSAMAAAYWTVFEAGRNQQSELEIDGSYYSFRRTSVTDDRERVLGHTVLVQEVTEQKRREQRLRELQRTAQRLSQAESTEEIGDIAVSAAVDVLGLEMTGIWEYDRHQNVLVPITETESARALIGDSPTFSPGESLAWEAFQSREPRVYNDIQSVEGTYNPETSLRSELLVPLGRYGLLSTGSTSSHEFSETEVDLFRILGATVEAALARADREAKLRDKNERLDEFASVLAHDLRNPLTVAIGRLRKAEQTGGQDHFDEARSAHDRMQRLLALARDEPAADTRAAVDLGQLATDAWSHVDTEQATLAVSEDLPTVTGDPGRLTQLFENLFRNAVEHGGTEISVEVQRLRDSSGFAVTDDGPGIPLTERATIFDHGVSSSDDGTGLGLSIVSEIVHAHGWSLSVTESTEGGARFEFVTS
jgi:PAS domain S-box-containing protein